MGAANNTRDDSLVKLSDAGAKIQVYRFGSSAVTKRRGENFWPTAFGLIIYAAL